MYGLHYYVHVFSPNLLTRQRHKQKGASQAQAGNTRMGADVVACTQSQSSPSPPSFLFRTSKSDKAFFATWGLLPLSWSRCVAGCCSFLCRHLHPLNKNGLSSTACGEGLENIFKDWFMRALPTKF